MRVTWLVVFVVVGVVGGQPGMGRRWEPPPNKRDYEAKVMIFHQPEPRLSLLEPKAPDSDGVVRHSTRNDIVGHIVQGLLRHRMSPREKEAYDRKVNAERLEEFHRMNAWREEEKVRAKAAQEELRKTRHEERQREQAMKSKEAGMRIRNLGRRREGRRGQKGEELRRGSEEVGGGGRGKWEGLREFQGQRRKEEEESAAVSSAGMRSNENWNGGGGSVRVSVPQEVPRGPLRRGGGRPSGNRGAMSLEPQQKNQFHGGRSFGGRQEERRSSLGSKEMLVPQELPRVPLTRGGSSGGRLVGPQQQVPISLGLPPPPQFQGSFQETRTSEDARRRNGGAPQPQRQVSVSEDSVQKIVRKSSRKNGGRQEVPQTQMAPPPPFLPQRNTGGPQQSISGSRKSSSRQDSPKRQEDRRQDSPRRQEDRGQDSSRRQEARRQDSSKRQEDRRQDSSRRQEDRRQGSLMTKQSQSPQASVNRIPGNLQMPSNEQQDRRQSSQRKKPESRRVSSSSSNVVIGEGALVQPQVNHKVAPDFPPVRLPLRDPFSPQVDNSRDKKRRQPQQPPKLPGGPRRPG